MSTNHISGTAEARVIKFCTQVGYITSQHTDDKLPPKWAWLGSRGHFKFCGPNDISGMTETKIVKFYTQVDYIKS